MTNWLRNNRGFLAFLILFAVFRTAVADWNPIPSGSMRPTLLEGDVVLVNRLAYNVKVPLSNIVVTPTGDPKRGDVVTFDSPTDGVRLIKRIVAIPGDLVEMRNERLVINGEPASYQPLETVRERLETQHSVDATRALEGGPLPPHRVQWLAGVTARDNFAPQRIPPDHYLMLGDNRDNSADSRYFGLVPRHLLIGKALGVIVSADIKGNWAPRLERFVSSFH